MVAAIPTTATPIPKNRTPTPRRATDLHRNPVRPPLIPSAAANGNAAAVVARRPAAKNIASRYLSSSSSSSSSTTTSSSSSPSPKPRPATPSSAKRSTSADRIRNATAAGTPSAAPRALCASTRSLSVSFQDESFFFRTSKTKPASPSTARKHTPERRRPKATATPARSGGQSDGSTPSGDPRRWPVAMVRQSNLLTRSLDFSAAMKEHSLTTAQLLQQSMVSDEGTKRASTKGLSVSSSDTESVSSGSGSTSMGAATCGVIVPGKFLQEANRRLCRLPEPCTPISTLSSKKGGPPKPVISKNLSVGRLLSSPRPVSSSLGGPTRPSSPAKHAPPSSRGMDSPQRGRRGASASFTLIRQPSSAGAIPNFTAEVRRAKKGENQIEEAHFLRLFYNQYLQWRFVNARSNAVLIAQRLTAEKDLYSAWKTTSELRESVTSKRINLQLLTQNLKLTSILQGQMNYLEEWSLMEKDHLSSLSGAIEALQASTLRLPADGGARADVQEVRNAVGSAVDVMQAMGSSICSSLEKIEGTSSLVSELAKVAAQERALLEQSRELLSMVAEMHVEQCSLQAHVLQRVHKPSSPQL